MSEDSQLLPHDLRGLRENLLARGRQNNGDDQHVPNRNENYNQARVDKLAQTIRVSEQVNQNNENGTQLEPLPTTLSRSKTFVKETRSSLFGSLPANDNKFDPAFGNMPQDEMRQQRLEFFKLQEEAKKNKR